MAWDNETDGIEFLVDSVTGFVLSYNVTQIVTSFLLFSETRSPLFLMDPTTLDSLPSIFLLQM